MVKTRIVKPRTAKQRESTNRFKRVVSQNFGNPFDPLHSIVRPVSHGPETSWWVGKPRDTLSQEAEAQRHRIAWSRFGKVLGSGVL